MREKLYCTVTSTAHADDVIARLMEMGIPSDQLVVADNAAEVENLAHPESSVAYSTKLGMKAGAVLGVLLGIALIIFTNSPDFYAWNGLILIPVGESFGWMLFGGIIGGSGILDRRGVSAKLERHFEEAIAAGKLLMTVRLNPAMKNDEVANALYAAGATDIHYVSEMAA